MSFFVYIMPHTLQPIGKQHLKSCYGDEDEIDIKFTFTRCQFCLVWRNKLLLYINLYTNIEIIWNEECVANLGSECSIFVVNFEVKVGGLWVTLWRSRFSRLMEELHLYALHGHILYILTLCRLLGTFSDFLQSMGLL